MKSRLHVFTADKQWICEQPNSFVTSSMCKSALNYTNGILNALISTIDYTGIPIVTKDVLYSPSAKYLHGEACIIPLYLHCWIIKNRIPQNNKSGRCSSVVRRASLANVERRYESVAYICYVKANYGILLLLHNLQNVSLHPVFRTTYFGLDFWGWKTVLFTTVWKWEHTYRILIFRNFRDCYI